jgi:hypothetical protein
LVKGFVGVHWRGFRVMTQVDLGLTGLTRLILSLSLMTVIKNLGRHSSERTDGSSAARPTGEGRHGTRQGRTSRRLGVIPASGRRDLGKARVARTPRMARRGCGARGCVGRATSRSGVESISKWPRLKAKYSKNLNRTALSFEYESCKALLGEYFS